MHNTLSLAEGEDKLLGTKNINGKERNILLNWMETENRRDQSPPRVPPSQTISPFTKRKSSIYNDTR